MSFTDLIRRSYRPEMAYRHVEAISQFHRIQASPGLRAAAQYVADQLSAAGLEATVHHYPAQPDVRFWAQPSFLEWACEKATLHLLDERGEPVESLCDFASVPLSVIQRSSSARGDFELVALGGKGGQDPADYEGVDVAGKLVLTNAAVSRVLEQAVIQRGAAGIVFDGMRAGGRSELDLPDARQYTSFWWHGVQPVSCFGFVLSPRQGQTLRAKLAEGKSVRVRAWVDSRFYAGSLEVADACIPGAATDSDEQILLLAHLCHPKPGAHDNGSGVGALIETAVTLARLIAEGQLPQPRRGIRFLWPPEFSGTYAWLAAHEAEVKRGRWVAGLNLDMVGADQCKTGSVWGFVALPQAGAAFADHLLSWLREPFLAGQRYEDAPFNAGSDHFVLSDPTVGIPTPGFTQWPDRFYHTSADTMDKVSPDSLGRSGALAAVYAYWLATAGVDEARWLGHWMVTRFATYAGQRAAQATEAVSGSSDAAARTKAWTDYARRSAFHADRMSAALGSLLRLANVADEVTSWRREVQDIAARQDTWVRARLGIEGAVEAPPIEEPWRAEASALVPRRHLMGPVEIGSALQSQPKELMMAYWQMADALEHSLGELPALAQFWADGQRTIAEIADLVSLEIGQPTSDLVLRFFKLLAQMNLIELAAIG